MTLKESSAGDRRTGVVGDFEEVGSIAKKLQELGQTYRGYVAELKSVIKK